MKDSIFSLYTKNKNIPHTPFQERRRKKPINRDRLVSTSLRTRVEITARKIAKKIRNETSFLPKFPAITMVTENVDSIERRRRPWELENEFYGVYVQSLHPSRAEVRLGVLVPVQRREVRNQLTYICRRCLRIYKPYLNNYSYRTLPSFSFYPPQEWYGRSRLSATS